MVKKIIIPLFILVAAAAVVFLAAKNRGNGKEVDVIPDKLALNKALTSFFFFDIN